MPNWTQVDEQSSELLHLYPNPSHDVLTISGLNPTGRYEIAWISSEGKLIGQQQASYVSQSAVVTTDLSPGMYFLRITDLKDQAVSTMRFIKQ